MDEGERIDGGFLLLSRGICQSSFMACPGNAFKVAIWLLAKARYKDYEWYDRFQRKRIVIHPGEVTFTIKQAAEETRLSRMNVRTALSHITSHGIFEDITPEPVKLTSGYKHYKAPKYQFYQDIENYLTTEQPRTNHGLTTIKDSVCVNSSLLKNNVASKEIEDKFIELWEKYPSRIGRKDAHRHFLASVRGPEDFAAIEKALTNYKNSERVRRGIIQNGSTWFNNWRDWVDYVEPKQLFGSEKTASETAEIRAMQDKADREKAKK